VGLTAGSTIAFCGVWALVGFTAGSKTMRFKLFGRWWASLPGQNHHISRCLNAGGPHRWVKTIALVGLSAGSKPSHFTVFGCWWNSPPAQNHRISWRLRAGGLHRHVKTIAFRNVWALVGCIAGSKPSRFAVFGCWGASPLGQSHCVSRCLGAGGRH
jgi:hypothetical protein